MAETRPRDKTGKFVESSPFGKNFIAVRLLKEDQDKFLVVSEELGVSPTELVRQVVSEWLKNQTLAQNNQKVI